MTKKFLFFFLLISFLQAPLLGQNLKQKWQAIKTQADTLEAHKDYQSALPLRLQEKDIALKKWKKPSEQYATAAYDLGLNYYYLTKLDSSLFFFQESLETREQMKDSTAKYIKVLSACIKINMQMNNYTNIALLYEKLSIASPKILAENNPDYIDVLNLLATFHQVIGEDEKAIPLLQKGLILSERLEQIKPLLHAQLLSNLGLSYYNLRRIYEAISVYDKALTFLREKSLTNTKEYAKLNHNLAAAYSDIGKHKLALVLYRQYLSLVEQGSIEQSVGLQNMGNVYSIMEQHDSSLIVLEQARRINLKIYKEPNPRYAVLQGIIAMNYNDMGKYEEALALVKNSLEILEKFNLKNTYYYASINNLLAILYSNMDQSEEALNTTKKSMQIQKEIAGEGLDYLLSLSDVSGMYASVGKYDTALICSRNALELCNKLEGSSYLYQRIYSGMGYAFRLTNQYDSALVYLQKSLSSKGNEWGENSHTYSTTLYSFYEVYQDMRHFSKAADYLTQNNQFFYQYYQKRAASLSEKDRQDLWRSLKHNYEALQSLCFLAKDSVPQLITQAYNNQLNTGGILLRGTENIAHAIRKNGDEKLVTLYDEWRYQKNQVTDWATWDSAQLNKGGIDLKAETEKINEMEQQLAQQSQVFRNAVDTISVQWQQVQAALQQGEVAVEIVQFRKYGKLAFTDTVHYAAFILTPETKDAPLYVPLPFGNKMENEWATEYQNYIEDTVNTLSFSRYFKPILAHIKDAKHIYFAADGIYHKINLNTLLAEDCKYLVEKYSLHKIASTRDLAKRKSAEELPTNQTAALFGNPTFRISKVEHDSLAQKVSKNVLASANLYREIAEDRDEFSNLPAAKEEVMAVKSILEKQHFEVKTYIEKEALEEEVRNLKHPGIILFATHGGFKEEPLKYKKMNNGFYDNPMYKSKLYFVGARNAALSKNDSTQAKHEDGILYAAEAALLDLQGTDLVVLSACETGLGTIQNGEGVWGLQRAFRIAGAKSLIMSLWKVDDKASKEFMTTFFENWLEKKMPKYAAFQQAQLSLMKEYPKEPKKWGGFVLLEGL